MSADRMLDDGIVVTSTGAVLRRPNHHYSVITLLRDAREIALTNPQRAQTFKCVARYLEDKENGR